MVCLQLVWAYRITCSDSRKSELTFSKPISLLRVTALEQQLSEALGRKVDLLTEAAISPYLQERIKRDLKVIYEA